MVEDPFGAPLANVPVTVKNAQGVVVAQGRTGADGAFKAQVVSYILTNAVRNESMNPYTVNTSFGGVSTSQYPGHGDTWEPANVAKPVAVLAPTTVVLQTNLVVRFNLEVTAMDPNLKTIAGATVTVDNAMGQTVATGVTGADGKYTALVIGYIQTPNGQDASMNPYSVTISFASASTAGYTQTKVEYTPLLVSESANVSKDTKITAQTGIRVFNTLTLTSLDKDGKEVSGVYIIIRDSSGAVVATGATSNLTGELGNTSFVLVGYIQHADGSMDTSMNPYTVNATFDSGSFIKQADMSSGNTHVDVKDLSPKPWDATPVIVLGVIAVVIVAIALIILWRRP
jgi:hypothetical protein